MKKMILRTALAVTFLTTSIYAGAQVTYTLANNNQVYTVINNAASPQMSGPYAVSGITDGQVLVAVDTRTNGDIYALAYDYTSGLGQLYYITNSNGNYDANVTGQAYAGLNLTPDNNVSSFAFLPAANNEIKLTDARNNSYIINTDDGSITDIGNDLTNEQISNVSGLNTDLLVYPNPVTTTARIVLPQLAAHEVFVNILDMNGHTVRSYEYGAGNYQLDMDMSRLPVGLYSVRVAESGMPLENLKVVKN